MQGIWCLHLSIHLVKKQKQLEEKKQSGKSFVYIYIYAQSYDVSRGNRNDFGWAVGLKSAAPKAPLVFLTPVKSELDPEPFSRRLGFDWQTKGTLTIFEPPSIQGHPPSRVLLRLYWEGQGFSTSSPSGGRSKTWAAPKTPFTSETRHFRPNP